MKPDMGMLAAARGNEGGRDIEALIGQVRVQSLFDDPVVEMREPATDIEQAGRRGVVADQLQHHVVTLFRIRPVGPVHATMVVAVFAQPLLVVLLQRQI